MNRRTFMQKPGLIMSGLISSLIGKSYSSIYGQNRPSNKVVSSSDAVAWDTGI